MIRHGVAKYVPETDFVVKVIDRHVERPKQPEGCADRGSRWLRLWASKRASIFFDGWRKVACGGGASRAAVDAVFLSR